MPAKLSKPNNYYVRGRDLVFNEYTHPGQIGEIPMFIHQTWKSDMMKDDYKHSFDNWSKLHPGFVHVLWTDDDNDLLVRNWFPQFLPSYSWLSLVIQKTDFVRLMYLYRYGGIYADMDYVAHKALPPYLPQLSGFMAVESPFSLSECLQNSLMISSPENQVVLTAMEIIDQSVLDLRSKKYKLDMKNKLYGPLLSTLYTLGLTGPQVLDKAVTRISTKKAPPQQSYDTIHPASTGSRKALNIVRLNETFFKGPVASHLQHNTWMHDIPKKCIPLICLTTIVFIMFIVFLVLITFFATKHRK
jgi:mannosyltransferase OCH1-like enzyme